MGGGSPKPKCRASTRKLCGTLPTLALPFGLRMSKPQDCIVVTDHVKKYRTGVLSVTQLTKSWPWYRHEKKTGGTVELHYQIPCKAWFAGKTGHELWIPCFASPRPRPFRKSFHGILRLKFIQDTCLSKGPSVSMSSTVHVLCAHLLQFPQRGKTSSKQQVMWNNKSKFLPMPMPSLHSVFPRFYFNSCIQAQLRFAMQKWTCELEEFRATSNIT